MIEKLKKCKERYNALTEALSKPDAANDREAYTALSREHAELSEIVAAYDRYTQTESERSDCLALLSDTTDPEKKALAKE